MKGGIGFAEGHEFEYKAVKEPHRSAVLTREQAEEIARNNQAAWNRFQEELLGEGMCFETLGFKDLQAALRSALVRKQAPDAVLIDGKFAHPSTLFGAAAYDAVKRSLERQFPSKKFTFSFNSAVGTLLDHAGVDAFFRVHLLDKETGKAKAKWDISVDFSMRMKKEFKSDVLVVGTPESLADEEIRQGMAHDLAEMAVSIMKGTQNRGEAYVLAQGYLPEN